MPTPQEATKSVGEAAEQLHRARENQAQELTAARARIDAVKQEVVDRARRMSNGSDRIELSASARLFLEESEFEETRSELVRELKAAYRDGTLNDPARIERAAQRLLTGE